MSVSYLFLGRPCHFDRKVGHEGDTNVDTAMSHSKKIKLHPILPQITPKKQEKSKSSMFLPVRKMQKEIEEEVVRYALLIRQSQTLISKPISTPIQELMEEFGDVFHEELHKGLTPMRGIEHAIDLILGALLPNTPAYRYESMCSACFTCVEEG